MCVCVCVHARACMCVCVRVRNKTSYTQKFEAMTRDTTLWSYEKDVFLPLPAGLTAGGGFFPAFGGTGTFALSRKRRKEKRRKKVGAEE